MENYRIGQLYMIAKVSQEQSKNGEGVEVIKNEPCDDPVHGHGQFTEKRIHLSNRLPNWIKAVVPKWFYVTEQAWNFYPFTKTDYRCSFIPYFSVAIDTRYDDNPGTTENILNLSDDQDKDREVDVVDIVDDELSERHYKSEEDLKMYKSLKTGRGPFTTDWLVNFKPVMCSYKLVKVKFEVWGLQTKVEDFTQKSIREVLLLGHRQAVAWMDDWIDMSLEDVRNYEKVTHEETNERIRSDLDSRHEPANRRASSSQQTTSQFGGEESGAAKAAPRLARSQTSS